MKIEWKCLTLYTNFSFNAEEGYKYAYEGQPH
jgi:hypothetical protein